MVEVTLSKLRKEKKRRKGSTAMILVVFSFTPILLTEHGNVSAFVSHHSCCANRWR